MRCSLQQTLSRLHKSRAIRHYCKALAELIISDGSDIMDLLNLNSTVEDLRKRLSHPELFSVSAKLTGGILEQAGAKSPMKVSPDEFNLSAEKYYRTTLNDKHIAEAFDFLEEDLKLLESAIPACNAEYNGSLLYGGAENRCRSAKTRTNRSLAGNSLSGGSLQTH